MSDDVFVSKLIADIVVEKSDMAALINRDIGTLDMTTVGASFARWPDENIFIVEYHKTLYLKDLDILIHAGRKYVLTFSYDVKTMPRTYLRRILCEEVKGAVLVPQWISW